jgi:hypothetical protein
MRTRIRDIRKTAHHHTHNQHASWGEPLPPKLDTNQGHKMEPNCETQLNDMYEYEINEASPPWTYNILRKTNASARCKNRKHRMPRLFSVYPKYNDNDE